MLLWKRMLVLFLVVSLAISCATGGCLLVCPDKSWDVEAPGGYVIILHGMGRTDRSMRRMERNLSDAGYEVVNMKYSSMNEPVDKLVEMLDSAIENKCTNKSKKINFVTHSLGGILVRCYLNDHEDFNVGRVVMLSPPNNGSELVDTFGDVRLYQFITGEAGQSLGTGTDDLPRSLGKIDYEVGIIAGDSSLNPFYSYFIDGPNDGKVSVESTKLEGMKDFLVVHSSHTFIMQRQFVIGQVLYFLEHGEFRKE
ncbi:esterase/lipase family protein [Verrucomicrobiota bacterium]